MTISDKLVSIAKKMEDVYDAGKMAEYDSFWDAYQNSGEIMDYNLRLTDFKIIPINSYCNFPANYLITSCTNPSKHAIMHSAKLKMMCSTT